MPNLLPIFLISIMWMGSLCLAALPSLLLESSNLVLRLLGIASALPVFVMSFLIVAGSLSRPAHKKIIRGKFPREHYHRIYFWRRIYGCCWTTVFYFKPLYSIYLAIPVLKKMLFRMFGYQGQMNFVVYPDTWIRDLPLLKFGEKAYCSNRATIGTNMCLMDGTILVDRVQVGDRAIVGHLTMMGPGARLENDAELGVGVCFGIRCRMKEGSKVGPGASVNHGTICGARSEIGTHSYIGLRVEIADDIRIPAGANIPSGAVISSQADVDKYISSENQILRQHLNETAGKLKAGLETISLNE